MNDPKIVYQRLSWIIRFVLSATFLLSALGKLLDRTAAIVSINRLFDFSFGLSNFVVIAFTLVEIAIAVLIWRKKFARYILAVPLIFLIVLLHSRSAGVDCGCFGTLPVLSQFSFGGHLLLIAGMFFGLLYLALLDRRPAAAASTSLPQSNLIRMATGWGGLTLILIAFASLLLPAQKAQSAGDAQIPRVDRQAVEAFQQNGEVIIVDARSRFEYELDHIAGAINIPHDSERLADLVAEHALLDQKVVVYCAGVYCDAAEILAGRLQEMGCREVSIYPGGWEEWIEFN